MADTRGIRELAREKMREIYRNSGHNFSADDIEKLCNDASKEIESWAAFAESIVEQCCKVAEDPKIWKKFADKDGKPASMSNLTVAGLAVARAIRSRWQRGEQ